MSNSIGQAQQTDRWSIKITLLLASTLTVMSGATISPSLPAMENHFAGVDNVSLWVRLVLTVPALLIVVGSPIAGQLVDRFGRKPLLFGSAVLYGLAGSSGLVLNSLFAILAGRAFLGLAVAGVMVSATTLIADYYQGIERADFMGLQAAFMGFGGVLFLSVGGFVADLSWRYPFAIYLLAWLLVPAIALILFEPQFDKTQADSSQPLSQFPVKLLAFIYASVLLQMLVFYLIPVQLPFYLQQLSGASASQAGLAIALSTLFSALASINYGKIKQRFSFISILAIAFSLMGAGYVGIGLTDSVWLAGSYWLVLIMLIPTGIGLGLILPNLNVWTSEEVPDNLRGRALGGLTTFMFLGQFLSPIASQPVSSTLGLAATYGLAGVLLVVVGALLWIFKKQICRSVESAVGRT